MRVVIVGAGQVGSSIAASLDADHEVVVVDRDSDRVDNLTYSLDVLAITGDGASLSTLREAKIETVDLLIASTDDDETNIVTCATAKTVSDVFTIARVKRRNYLATWQEAGTVFGVDFMVCTNLLAAETVVRVIGLPAARDVHVFTEGRVVMAEFRVPEGSPIAGRTVAEADRFPELTFTAILRNEEIILPEGGILIEVGDELIVIGSPENVHMFADGLAPLHDKNRKDIVIVGGSEIAGEIARLLEDRGLRSRLIERDPNRARELAEKLTRTTVMVSDATSHEFLNREHIGDSDVVITALENDEKNLLASLLATRLGVPRTIALVETAENTDLFETVGVGAAINPRKAAAEEIIRLTRGGHMEKIAIIDNDRAEVLEIETDDNSVLVGRSIRESAVELPRQMTIGAIIRGGEFVTPRGDTVVEVGDHVVVFTETNAIDAISAKI